MPDLRARSVAHPTQTGNNLWVRLELAGFLVMHDRHADDPQRLALMEVVGDAVDGMHHTVLGVEANDEILDLQNGRHERAPCVLAWDPTRCRTCGLGA